MFSKILYRVNIYICTISVVGQEIFENISESNIENPPYSTTYNFLKVISIAKLNTCLSSSEKFLTSILLLHF